MKVLAVNNNKPAKMNKVSKVANKPAHTAPMVKQAHQDTFVKSCKK
ncbi:MAG: hypothetical protein PHE78_03580 [Candidatus Gastranaerophilales bacterium]|jgi:hypothetical protein|nr:hypothetical protein [Candidatus Gastranaerophilales bacterium]